MSAQWETWVTFTLDAELFAVSVESVTEIVRVKNITRVPHAPRAVRGIINLRGRVVPTVDLRVRIGLAPSELSPRSRVLVCRDGERLIGLLVDAAHHVVRLDRTTVAPPPADVMSGGADYVLGVHLEDNQFVILLEATQLLSVPDELHALSNGHSDGPSDPHHSQQGTVHA